MTPVQQGMGRSNFHYLAGWIHFPDAPRRSNRPAEPIRAGAATLCKEHVLISRRSSIRRRHSKARFFRKIDANYKQFKTASRLRGAAAQRLDAQRAYYEEGRITIDRFLDAVSQFATAVATEAQYKTTYNISIVALEAAQEHTPGVRQHRRGRGPASGQSIRAGPRHPERPPPAPYFS